MVTARTAEKRMLLLACAPVAYGFRREIPFRSAYRAWVLSMPKIRERSLRVAISGNKDPCFSSHIQPREETVKQLPEPGTWSEIMDVESPELPPLFGNNLTCMAGEDDEDEELTLHLLDDNEE